jgi:hypothetical protein
MFQRKLIAVFGAVALLAATAGVSQASLSRLEGMGLGEQVLGQFTDDYANIFYFPTSVVRQNNLVLAELGENSGGSVDPVSFEDQSLTLIKNFPKFGSIAYQMKQSALNSSFPSNLTNEQIDLIWGTALTKLDIAVRFDMTSSSFEHDDNAGPTHFETKGLFGIGVFDPYPFGAAFAPNTIVNNAEINTWGVTPAVALHLSNDNRIEAALTLRNYTLDRNVTVAGVAGETWETQGDMSYNIAARAFLHQGDRATWVPAIWYANDNLSYDVTNITGLGPRSVDETYKSLGLGISHNMRVNDNNLLIFGVAAWQQKSSYERTDPNADTGGTPIVSTDLKTAEFEQMLLPLFFASLETDATSWLKVRLGATKSMVSLDSETTDFDAPTLSVQESAKGSSFDFSLGTGIRWNNLDIDMTLNEAFPLSGGWGLSGDPATPFTRASATYHF